MIVVGLTGGPGGGKTSVAEILRELGAIILSGDEAGKKAVEIPSIARRIIATFGQSVMEPSLELNRRKLGRLVFSNAQMLIKLNEIVHPALLRILKSELASHARKGQRKIVVIDAALIFEWGIADWCDVILTVTANRNIRIRRLVKSGLTTKEAEDRIGSQLPERDKIALADFVIRNNGTKAELRRATLEFVKSLKAYRKKVGVRT